MKKIYGWFAMFFAFAFAMFVETPTASATAAYDSIVTAADLTGLGTTQVTLLVGMIGFVVVSVAYAIVSNTLKKGKGASR